ncbi:ThiJ/PfpI [Setomelanomma holmii]|uniref:ThiJ/PfpI n=1 Tax=Setomelanomma holmii TaxID=210430 RepID=A0A9P4HDJ1_9PLEO|nr:ThiJ/PfpI [Setomelanomma holmii]
MGILKALGAATCLLSIFPIEAAALTTSAPLTYGIVLFRMFDVLDVHGPTEVLQVLSASFKTDIVYIAETMEPVTTRPTLAAMNPLNSSVYPLLPPTHTLATAPELDVLIIPGGPGWRDPALNATLDYIRATAPKVKHVITICTGAALAARAGIMDGRKATTNKSSWPNAVLAGPNTTWIPSARWVEDNSSEPPVWSSSGVTAGIDLMLHWVEEKYNKENATNIAKFMEHVRIRDPAYDPFARNETVST